MNSPTKAPMKLIGITGKARSGKDTLARILFAEYAFTRIAFADPLKLAAQHIFGLTQDQTWLDEVKETILPYWNMSPRRMLQLLGSDATKPVFGNELWVKRWFLSYDMLRETDDIVVPDVRFDNECLALRNLGGVIIEVRRGTGLVGSTGDHVSERGLSTLPDFVIENDGTIDELRAKIRAIVEVL